jgi:hypothetical protein
MDHEIAKESIAVDYYMNSADEYVKRAERMLVKSRARANSAAFKRKLAETRHINNNNDNNGSTPTPHRPLDPTPPPPSGFAAAIAAVHAAEAI